MKGGLYYTHTEFRDVYFYLKKAFYVPEKDIYKLNIIWLHKRNDRFIFEDKLTLPATKCKEFKLIGR